MLNTVALLIPVFLLIVVLEWYVSYKKENNRYSSANTIMNLTIGAIDQVSSLLYLVMLYFVMEFVYAHFRLFEMQNNWLQWVLAYIAVDFISYWYHRWSHRINILWAGHVTHHSSELFNFSNGFRTSLFQGINRIIFWAVLPVFGFSPWVLVITLKVSGIYDFLLHTEYIPKLGFLEKIFITPSAHRVHHGKNELYIDKNYGSTFVIWDKMFGTYQEETEKVEYGIKSNYIDNNPLAAIGHHYQYLWNAMISAKKWTDKVKVWIMPPEWKPENVYIKQTTVAETVFPVSNQLRQYAYFQICVSAAGLITMLVYKEFLTVWELMLFSGIGIISMMNAARICKENIKQGFVRREFYRLSCAVLCSFVLLSIHPRYYIWPLILFFLVSMILISRNSVTELVAQNESSSGQRDRFSA
ncbi:MAG: sterol desaturase family protein [Bacteroidota bacterium]